MAIAFIFFGQKLQLVIMGKTLMKTTQERSNRLIEPMRLWANT